jgi:hypothetical protein
MIKCKQFVHTISHDHDDSWKKKMGMWVHYFICIHCRRYVQQLNIIKTRIKEYYKLKNKEEHAHTIQKIEENVLDELFKK